VNGPIGATSRAGRSSGPPTASTCSPTTAPSGTSNAIEWQRLTPEHGYTRPEAVEASGAKDRFDEAMARSAKLYEDLSGPFPEDASYAVSLAYRVRFVMQMNAREAMHLIELRTTPQGHPAYRLVGQEMHRLIAEEAGHTAIAEMMRFVDHSAEPELERLQAERRAESRRLGR
jgi:thymidylate synthase ThyX